MNKVVLSSLSIIFLLILFFLIFRNATGFIGFGQPQPDFAWWNISWKYRFKIEINSTDYIRTDFPVEYQVNFTDLLPNGTFDENSTRVFEYNSSGYILNEAPSQFDKSEDYSSTNAAGTLVFSLNGTTDINTKRIFFVYYDTVENGVKQPPNYPSDMSYNTSTSEGEINVNNTLLAFWIDPQRGENTSGLVRVLGINSQNDIFKFFPPLPDTDKTYEYSEYSNGTYNFSFSFANNNATVKYNGPIRLVIEQKGKETIWNSTNETNEGFMVKKYVFYNNLQWIRIETNFTNIASNSINRNSTFAGALAIDASRAFGVNWKDIYGNSTQPGWWYAADKFGSVHAGTIQINQTGTSNYWVPNSTSQNRTGIQLNSTNISAGSSITENLAIHFNDTQGDYNQVNNLRDQLANSIIITQSLPERWYVAVAPSTNATVYNRNETLLVIANISVGDPYNLTKYINATLDMGTPSSSDDQTIVLYDDGTHDDAIANDKIFAGDFNISNDATLGIWEINFTTYSNVLIFLNSTNFNFNVTDILNVSVNVTTKKVIVGGLALANINVKNYRRDLWLPGATINCSYDVFEVINKTDFNNGTYSVNFTAPIQEGEYNLYCNTTLNGNFGNGTNNFTVEAVETNISIVVQPSNPLISNVSLYNNDSFAITADGSNPGNATAYNTNISLELLNGWSANSTLHSCGDLDKNDHCSSSFNITIPNATSPGNYYINVTAIWRNPDTTIFINKTQVNVTVGSNPKISIVENKISSESGDGISNIIGNFTVFSIGNDQLTNITFSCISGDVCNNFAVNFTPINIPNISAGLSQSVMANVTVPLSYPAGTYNGTVNVSAENDNFDTIVLEVTVPENRTWDLNPSSCIRSTQEPEGTACEVNVANLGNIQINFTISPPQGLYTTVNETSFVVNRSTFHTFNVTYNTTGVPPNIYNSTFVVSAVQANANPSNRTLDIYLFPYVPPILNISLTPNETEQNSSITIFANITDRSGSGISWTKANITHPDGTVDTVNMILNSTNGNLTQWQLTYPNSTYGSTNQRGIHNVTVYAEDNIGNVGNSNSSFLIYIKLNIIATTLADKYFQGDSGSIFYLVRNNSGYGIPNVATNFTIMNSQQNITYVSSNFSTNFDGTITPMPTFSTSSDSSVGNYSLLSSSFYFDSIANKTFQIQKNSTFQVLSRTVTVTGLFADMETAVVWYPVNNMTFGILVYNGEGRPVDPTSMNLTVYDPVNSLYLTVNMSQMTKQAVGYYSYAKAMGADTPSGMFLAVLNVGQGDFQTMKLKAFRVAHGGPYDVLITLLKNEVPQGGYLDFVLNIENKGEVSQDVTVQYWVSSLNNTYFKSASESRETLALSNQSFTMNVPIYSTQPLGNYFLNVRVTYDPVQSPILVNSSFIVVSPVNVTTGTTTFVTVPYSISGAAVAGTVTATSPTPEKLPKISISSYNSNISLARGFSGIESIVVNNTGDFDLHNVSLMVVGIPTDWFSITPDIYRTLQKGNSTIFIINFNIPKNVSAGSYGATLVASSAETLDQKKVTLTVFESLEELLKQELQKLKDDFQELQVDTKVAEREGKDVSAISIFINEIKTQIDSAEENLANHKATDALNNVSNARNLILKARDLLNKLSIAKVQAFVLPLWSIFVILIIVIAAVVSVFLWKKKKVPTLRPWIVSLGKSIDLIRKKKTVSQEDIQNERQKLLRMLEVLEKEKDEKIISLSAYKEMKKTIEKKLASIEGKIY